MKVNGQIFIATGCRGAFFANAREVLPLNLLSFYAKRIENTSILSWNTSDEKFFSHFEIQKSRNLNEFSTIGTVDGNNLSNGNYNFTDFNPDLFNINYYRIRMIDKDGSSKFSKVMTLNFSKNDFYFSVENPVKNNEILVNTNCKNPQFYLYDNLGKMLDFKLEEVLSNAFKLKLKGIIKGQYYLKLQSSEYFKQATKIFIP
jgi:hypothetical protein